MRARPLFLRAFAAVYACAFVSYWLQFDGLFGADGLLPAAKHHEHIAARVGSGVGLRERLRTHPSALWLLREHDDADVAMELCAVIGTLCAMLAIAGLHHGSLFALMFFAYLTLFSGGQTFLSFQWDLFLLETGAAAILYAPWLSLTADDATTAVAHPMTWPLRVSWIK